ncbi:transcriptional regulator, AraC family with amidase-like domain [Pseudomonas duriflava]|uniref:Transcriptional regulator, AraC family with amidase-like domain n=1 Tax=Pseudomonas duriflava TaxID=459528 RepID=A0A562Q9W8_9PSED|nr:GlxA family transcriptional regulator [Pseudomonas duriflava]TWI52816.1 transcriptional regulator, AraC family with amidase-like domain [Pseudomonas duriflava]
MNTLRTIASLLYPDVMSLDVTGPLQVFASANVERQRQGLGPVYCLKILGDAPGPIVTSAGFRLHADEAWCDTPAGMLDTLLIPGGAGVEAQCQHTALLNWLRDSQPTIRRLGSVCSGALILAAVGLLNGRRATTHWADVGALACHDNVIVEGDRLHTYDPSGKDGYPDVFTSAGVTAGIDLALALVEADLGRPMALLVARRLVMFLRRPGGQTQFSACLSPDPSHTPRLAMLLDWIPAHLSETLTLERLAEQAHMTPRTLSRLFIREVGMGPGRYIEQLRVETARALLHDAQASISTVARLCGFGHPENLRRTFQKHLAVSPQAYMARFGS